MSDYVPVSAADVTDELVSMAIEIVDGWYQGNTVDWEDVLDRLDGQTLEDGRTIDFGNSTVTPAVGALKRRVRKATQDS